MPTTPPKLGRPAFNALAALDVLAAEDAAEVAAEDAALVWELIADERLLASEDAAEESDEA